MLLHAVYSKCFACFYCISCKMGENKQTNFRIYTKTTRYFLKIYTSLICINANLNVKQTKQTNIK